MIEMKSSTWSSLASITSVTSSATRSSMCSRVSSSSWVAPRTALTATRRAYRRPGSELRAVHQLAQLRHRQLAHLPRPQPRQPDRADLGAGEPAHRVTDVGEQAPHDAVAPLVDGELDDRALAALAPRVAAHHPGLRDRH